MARPERARLARRNGRVPADEASVATPTALTTPEAVERRAPIDGVATARRSGPAGAADPLGGTAAAPDVVAALQRRRGKGQALPADVATQYGEQLATDLSGVRVHADGEADRIARSVQATAFTHGSDIYFSQGSYAPGSGSGRHLLAHELAHVAQQRGGSAGSPPGTVIGRADDPAEREADRVADGVVSALQRRASSVAPSAAVPAPDAAIQRWPWSKKKSGDGAPDGGPGVDGAPVKVDKRTAKKKFTDALGSKKPKDDGEGASRMVTLRTMLTAMTPEERETIATDSKLMKKARTYIGNHEYMSLVAAVGMSYKPDPKKKKKGAPEPTGPKHMSGAEADTFIQANMGKIGHLKGFIDTAVGAGKKAEGFVATVGDDDWNLIYQTQYPGEEIGDDEETGTNAFIANTHSDRPAIINHDRGTRSTAIHESMHRYSVLNVLNEFGFRLNEGMTEYFTRLITDKDGNPVNGGASNRDNYQSNWEFVGSLLAMLGDDLVAQQTELAEIYFSGGTDRIKSHFDTACGRANLSPEDTAARWLEFLAALKGGNWDDARAKFPPPPAPPVQPPVVPVVAVPPVVDVAPGNPVVAPPQPVGVGG
jgi:hypothetical protein